MPDPYSYRDPMDRLTVVETNVHNVQDTLETIQKISKEHRELHSEQTESIRTRMEEVRAELKTDINVMKADLHNQNQLLKKISEKLDSVEKWRWVLIGGATTVGFLFTEAGKHIMKLFN